MIDPATHRAASYQFDEAQLDGVRELLAGCGGICELGLKEASLFDGRRLIFSLGHETDLQLHYALDLAAPAAAPTRISLEMELDAAEKAWTETFVAEEKNEENGKPRPVTLSGKAYRFGQIETLPGATVAIAREERPNELSAAERRQQEWFSLIGVRHGRGGLEQIWERPISVATERFITDEESDAVYFAEAARSTITVAGVRAADGRPLSGFPANFGWRTINGQRFEVAITGTAVDSQKGLVYLHDLSKNRIVCVKHRFAT